MGSQAWWYIPEIPNLRRLKQEAKELEANLGYYTHRLPPMEKIYKGIACVCATFSCILGVQRV